MARAGRGRGDAAFPSGGHPGLQRRTGRSQHRGAGYRRDMSARKRPTVQDAATARQVLLDAVEQDVEIAEILNRLAPLHPRNDTFPGEVLTHLAADALAWAAVDPAHPVELTGFRERFLPDCAITGRDRRKLQFAVLAAAARHGGVEADLLDEVAYWQTDDFWRYAACTAIAYIRMAADRAAVPEPEVCRGLAQTQAR